MAVFRSRNVRIGAVCLASVVSIAITGCPLLPFGQTGAPKDEKPAEQSKPGDDTAKPGEEKPPDGNVQKPGDGNNVAPGGGDQQKPADIATTGMVQVALRVQGDAALAKLDGLRIKVKASDGKVTDRWVKRVDIKEGGVTIVIDGVPPGAATVYVEAVDPAGAILAKGEKPVVILAGKQVEASVDIGLPVDAAAGGGGAGGGLSLLIKLREMPVGSLPQLETLANFEGYMYGLMEFADLGKNTTLFKAIKSWKKVLDTGAPPPFPMVYFSARPYDGVRYEADSSGLVNKVVYTRTNKDGVAEEAVIDLTATGLGSNTRKFTATLSKSPDNTTGFIEMEVTAGKWVESTYGGGSIGFPLPILGMATATAPMRSGYPGEPTPTPTPTPARFHFSDYPDMTTLSGLRVHAEFKPQGADDAKMVADLTTEGWVGGDQLKYLASFLIKGFEQSGQNCYTPTPYPYYKYRTASERDHGASATPGPIAVPSGYPTSLPSYYPTEYPSYYPTQYPSSYPTQFPSYPPTPAPTPHCYPINDYSKPIYYQASDITWSWPTKAHFTLSVPGFGVDLAASADDDRKGVSLGGKVGRLEIEGKARLDHQDGGPEMATGAHVRLVVSDPQTRLRFPATADTTFVHSAPLRVQNHEYGPSYYGGPGHGLTLAGYEYLGAPSVYFPFRQGATVANVGDVLDMDTGAHLARAHVPLPYNYTGMFYFLLADGRIKPVYPLFPFLRVYNTSRDQLKTIGW